MSLHNNSEKNEKPRHITLMITLCINWTSKEIDLSQGRET